MLPLLNACIRTFTTSMGFVVAVAHATEMPDTNIGSAKEYAEEEEDDNDVEFSRRSRSLLICLRAFPKWKSHLCCTFTIHKNTRDAWRRKKTPTTLARGRKKRHSERERKRERKKESARSSLSLSLCFCEEELLTRTFGTFWEAEKGKYENPKLSPKISPCVLSGGKKAKNNKILALSSLLFTKSRARLIRKKSRERERERPR